MFDPGPTDRLYPGGSFSAGTHSGVATIKPGNQKNVASSHVQRDGDVASSGINPADQTQPENKTSKHEQATYLHPLPLLVKQTQRKTIEGLSFPTVPYFKQFVELMKNSYLTPGKDSSRFFQTARAVMENEFTSNAQDATADYRPDSSEESSDQDKTWSESTNSVENDHRDHFQKLSVPDSARSTAGSSLGENQDFRLNTLAQGPVSGGFAWTGAGDLPAGLRAAAGPPSRDAAPVSLGLTEQMPSGSFVGELASAEALISPADGAAQDLDPKASEGMSQESDSEDSFKYENPSGGFQLGGFQKEDLPERFAADVPYSPKASPPVGRRNKGNGSGRVPKAWESLSSSSQTHPSTAGEEESKGPSRSLTHPLEFGSWATSKATLGPQGRRGQAGDPLGSPHVLEYGRLGRRQPLRSPHVGSNTIFGMNRPRLASDLVQASGPAGVGSAQRWALSPYKLDHGSHLLSKLAWPSASDTTFWRKIGQKGNSRNSKMKNMMSGDPNVPRSFLTAKKRGETLKGGWPGPAEAAIPHTSVQDKVYRPPQPVHASKSGAFQSGGKKGRFYQTGDGLSLPFYTTKTTSNYFRSKVSFSKTHYAPL